MTRAPVTSSNIVSIGHDPATQKLHVEFRGHAGEPGRVYEYDDVPAHEHALMLAAESVGKRFHSHIRNKFVGRRVAA